MDSSQRQGFELRARLKKAHDWSDKNERNLLIYESVEPLAKMYSPFHELNDTFVLQEFFVPAKNFTGWLQQSKPILSKKY